MKQQKVLNKIKHSINCGQKTPLGTKPNDECYTSMQDIINELGYWAGLNKFENKRIICPCDWDIVEGENIYSITISYEDKFKVTGNDVYKEPKVTYDLWNEEEDKFVTIDLKEDEVEDFLKNKLTCNFIRTFTQKARAWKIKSITASGYNPANGKGVKFQDVDYSKYDICCTNPPFSLYAEFMKTIVGKIDFIVLAPFLNRVTPNVGGYLFRREAYLGYGAGIPDMNFYNPITNNLYKTKIIAVDWITSFSDAQDERNEELQNKQTGIDYNIYKDEYIEMENMIMKDGTKAIRVPAAQIPDNYSGWMFTSVQFLQLYDLRKYDWYPTNLMGYYNSHPEINPFKGKAGNHVCKHNGKNMFHGIVFRRKSEEVSKND